MADKREKTIHIPEDVDFGALAAYVAGNGPMPAGCWEEDVDTFMARGRVADCTCGQIQCVCAVIRAHEPECKFRKAIACAIPIECDHGRDVCSECDPCTCKWIREAAL